MISNHPFLHKDEQRDTGGGVYVENNGKFTLTGGEISGNTVSGSDYVYGGGVYVSSGVFAMSGGEISGNTAAASYGYGGGVYVYSNGTFTKQSGGTIYGSNASNGLKNTTTSGDTYGHAVCVDYGSKLRNSTAGTGVTLNSGTSGAAGGWE